MIATTVNNKGKNEKNKKVKAGPCIIPFKYKRATHEDCIDTEKGPICATEINPKTRTLTKYGYCPVKDKNRESSDGSKSKQNSKKTPDKASLTNLVKASLLNGPTTYDTIISELNTDNHDLVKTVINEGITSGKIKMVGDHGDSDSFKGIHFELVEKKMKTAKKEVPSSSNRTMKKPPKQKPKLRIVNRLPATRNRRNDEYISVLEELQDINARRGEPFRARAYQKAAESIMLYTEDITSPDDIKDLPGIGDTILSKLKEFDETGTLRAIEKQKKDPLNVLTKVYGIGPKKAKVLIAEGITTIAELKNNIDKLDRVQRIGLDNYEAIEERIPRQEIDKFQKVFSKAFKSLDIKGGEFQIVGSYRRGAKSSGDIDVIITNKDSNSPEILSRFIATLKREGVITHILSQGRSKCLAIGQLTPESTPRRLDFLFAPADEYAFATLYFTGSKTFNTRQRQRALDLGYTLNEHGLYHLVSGKKGSKVQGSFPDEKSIFTKLGMEYFSPKERDDPRRPLSLVDTVKIKSTKSTDSKQQAAKKGRTPAERLELFASQGSSYLDTLSKKEIQQMLALADKSYYEDGKPLLSDDQYDALHALVAKLRLKTGHQNIDSKAVRDKVKLPFEMWSMDKIKPDTKALDKWVAKYKGPYVLSCKLDGVSGLFTSTGDEAKLYTRGNGKFGQDISRFIPFIGLPKTKDVVIRGEFIVPKQLFAKKYAKEFSNARNFVAGVLNSKTPNEDRLKDISFVAYELIEPVLKPVEQMQYLMDKVDVEVVEHAVEKKITNELLSEMLTVWREGYKFEVDGVVCTNDGLYKRKSKNPLHAFAFKMVLSDQVAEAQVVDVIWTPSKDGIWKPRVKINPVVLGGAKIEFATGFNAKFIVDNSIGVGAIISLIRSGDVIPHIQSVIRPAPEPLMPDRPYVWNSTHVDILLVDKETDSIVQEKQIVGFFKTLDVEGLRAGYVKRLIEAGYDTVPKILDMTEEEFTNVRGVKGKLAKKMYEGIKSKMSSADLPLIMHATNIFGRGLGKKKLRTILTANPGILVSTQSNEEKVKGVEAVSGMGKKTSELFVDQIPVFLKWAAQAKLKKLTFTPSPPKTGPLTGVRVALSGFRDSDLVKEIEEAGGEVSTSVSAGITMLIVDDIDSDSGKAEKARELDIPLVTLEQFRDKYKF